MYYYYAYNFIIESDFQIPIFEGCAPDLINIDVESISIRKLTKEKKDEILEKEVCSILSMKYPPLTPYLTDKYLILKCLNMYLVVVDLSGERIYVDLDSIDPAMSMNVALGGALSICMAIHGYTPLHAMAVEYKNKPLTFIAPSKAGKSTLEYYLINNGCKSITDDVLPVKMLNNIPTCFSSKYLKIKIDTKLASMFEIPLDIKNIVTPYENKYWLSLPFEKHSQINHSLNCFFYLNPSNDHQDFSITRISRLDSINLIVKNLHFIQFYPTNLRNQAVKNALENLKNINFYSINYKKKFENIAKIIDATLHFDI